MARTPIEGNDAGRAGRHGGADPDESGAEVHVVHPGTEVVVRGRLDAHCVAAVREALHLAVDQGTGDLVVHLGRAEVVDATGLGVIVGVHRRARLAQRRLVLLDVPPRLERLIRLTRLHRVLVRGDSAVPA